MTPEQQLDYLIGQVQNLGAVVQAGNAGADPDKARRARETNRPAALRLLGYALALEHAGTLPRAVADRLLPMLEGMATD